MEGGNIITKKIKIKKETFDKIIFYLGLILCVLIIMETYVLIAQKWNSLYDKESFNCVDMSYAVGDFFKSFGIPVQIVYGIDPVKQVGHCWLILDGWIEFESTTLYPKFWDKNSEHYKFIIVEDL